MVAIRSAELEPFLDLVRRSLTDEPQQLVTRASQLLERGQGSVPDEVRFVAFLVAAEAAQTTREAAEPADPTDAADTGRDKVKPAHKAAALVDAGRAVAIAEIDCSPWDAYAPWFQLACEIADDEDSETLRLATIRLGEIAIDEWQVDGRSVAHVREAVRSIEATRSFMEADRDAASQAVWRYTLGRLQGILARSGEDESLEPALQLLESAASGYKQSSHPGLAADAYQAAADCVLASSSLEGTAERGLHYLRLCRSLLGPSDPDSLRRLTLVSLRLGECFLAGAGASPEDGRKNAICAFQDATFLAQMARVRAEIEGTDPRQPQALELEVYSRYLPAFVSACLGEGAFAYWYERALLGAARLCLELLISGATYQASRLSALAMNSLIATPPPRTEPMQRGARWLSDICEQLVVAIRVDSPNAAAGLAHAQASLLEGTSDPDSVEDGMAVVGLRRACVALGEEGDSPDLPQFLHMLGTSLSKPSLLAHDPNLAGEAIECLERALPLRDTEGRAATQASLASLIAAYGPGGLTNPQNLERAMDLAEPALRWFLVNRPVRAETFQIGDFYKGVSGALAEHRFQLGLEPQPEGPRNPELFRLSVYARLEPIEGALERCWRYRYALALPSPCHLPDASEIPSDRIRSLRLTRSELCPDCGDTISFEIEIAVDAERDRGARSRLATPAYTRCPGCNSRSFAVAPMALMMDHMGVRMWLVVPDYDVEELRTFDYRCAAAVFALCFGRDLAEELADGQAGVLDRNLLPGVAAPPAENLAPSDETGSGSVTTNDASPEPGFAGSKDLLEELALDRATTAAGSLSADPEAGGVREAEQALDLMRAAEDQVLVLEAALRRFGETREAASRSLLEWLDRTPDFHEARVLKFYRDTLWTTIDVVQRELFDAQSTMTAEQKDELREAAAREFTAVDEMFKEIFPAFAEHETGKQTLRETLKDERPLILILQSYAADRIAVPTADASVLTGDTDELAMAYGSTTITPMQPSIVKLVGGELSAAASTLGIEDPHDTFPGFSFPRLRIANDEWRDVVAALIKRADRIVFFLDRPTQGLLEELSLTAMSGGQSKAFVVRLRDASEKDDSAVTHLSQVLHAMREGLRGLRPAAGSPHEDESPEWPDPILESFPNQLDESEVEGDVAAFVAKVTAGL